MNNTKTCLLSIFMAIAGVVVMQVDGATQTAFYGPVPYLSPSDIPTGIYTTGAPTVIEDFEDLSLDFGITASTGGAGGPGIATDSVDSDDGAIDGSGHERSWYVGTQNADVTFFLPTGVRAAGLVWTDASTMVLVVFEAFGPGMSSLGSVGPFVLGDGQCCINQNTSEDRFFGVTDPGGIMAIRIHQTALSGGFSDMEVDHVQYETSQLPVPNVPLEVGSAWRIDPLAFAGAGDWTGSSIVYLGDLGACAPTKNAIAVGASQIGGAGKGKVLILFLDASGHVASQTVIAASSLQSVPAGRFGVALADLGDFPAGRALAVGCPDFPGGLGRVFVIFLNTDGTLAAEMEIADAKGGLPMGSLGPEDVFGNGVASLGDIDQDGVTDLAVGAPGDDDAALNAGALWCFLLKPDGSVKAHQKLTQNLELLPKESFGDSMEWIGNLGPSAPSSRALAVGGYFGNNLTKLGRVRILFLAPAVAGSDIVSLVSFVLLEDGVGGILPGTLAPGDRFGRELGRVEDLDQDGVPELLIGAELDSDGGAQTGAAWLTFLTETGNVKTMKKIGAAASCFDGDIGPGDSFGRSVCAADLTGDELPEILVCANRDDGATDATNDVGTVWLLNLVACAKASTAHYGVSTPGTNGAPMLDVIGSPALGGELQVQVISPQNANTLGALFLGFAPGSLVIRGGTLLVDITQQHAIVVLPIPAGGFTTPDSPVACDPTLCGVSLYLQYLEQDPGAPAGVAFSDGIQITLGT